MDALLTEEQASPLAGLAVSTLQKLRVTGGGPPYCKIGRNVRYRASDLEAWISTRVITSTSEKAAA
ncbi:MAG: helix-turn-helix domain-containing protein [Sphingomicrobium sp.]